MIAELLLEAVENSVEAGAGYILVSAALEEGLWSCSVVDDGHWDSAVSPFSGVSSKGDHRGRGLVKIKQNTESCSIKASEDGTLLSFKALDDHSLDDLFSATLSLLLWPCHIRLEVKRGGRTTALDSDDLTAREAFPQDARGIARFRELLQAMEA